MQSALEQFGSDDPYIDLMARHAEQTNDWNPLIERIGMGITNRKKSEAQLKKEQREEEYDNRAAERDNKLK